MNGSPLRPARKWRAMKCPYCGGPAELVAGDAIYPHRPDLYERLFWRCAPCAAWCGTHKGTTRPLGRLAGSELRALRSAVHAAFDPLWRSGEMTRSDAYRRLSESMGIDFDDCHVGMFDEDQCRLALSALATGLARRAAP